MMGAFNFTATRGLSLLGDEVGAWMADTTEETLVGDGWFTTTPSSVVSPSTILGNKLISGTGITSTQIGAFATTATPDDQYVITTIATVTTGTVKIFFGDNLVHEHTSSGTLTSVVSYVGGSHVLTAYGYTSYTGEVEVSVLRLAVPDLSIENNGLGVHGSITKTAVNTGADLVGYKSSGGGYLEQPYNSDIDPTTGPLSVSFWIEPATLANELVCDHRTSGDAITSGFGVHFRSDGTLLMQTRNGASVSSVYSTAIPVDEWSHCDVEINAAGTLIDWYVDGALVSSTAVTARDMTNTVAVTRWLVNVVGSADFTGRITLPKIATVARTAAQIKSTYDKEKHLFKKHSYYTQEGESYDLDIQQATPRPSIETEKTTTKTLSGKARSIVRHENNTWDIQTSLIHRTDGTDYLRKSEFVELMYSTNGSEQFTYDPYGTVAAPDEPIDVQRSSNQFSLVPEENTEFFRAAFTVREVND